MPKTHSCLKRVDQKLKSHNTRLVTNLLNPNQVMVATEKIRKLRDGKKAKLVVAAYCPFCGEKLR